MAKNRIDPGMNRWFVPEIRPGFVFDSMPITLGEVFSIFFMQRWGLFNQLNQLVVIEVDRSSRQ